MSNVDGLMKAMENPGALDEETLAQIRKDWFDPLILEQHKMDAAGAFDGDSFRLPDQLIWDWEEKMNARLPIFLKDFVHEMHCVDFRKMTPSTRRTLWFGVRICYGLSESDFPYPEKLKELDLGKNKSPEKTSDFLGLSIPDPPEKYRLPSPFALLVSILIVFLAFLVLCSRHPASRSGHVHSAHSGDSLPDSLHDLPAAPERSIPPTPNPFLPPPRWVGPGSPGHP